MDSLLANYASSGDDEEELTQQQQQEDEKQSPVAIHKSSSSSSSIFSSLPRPKSSSSSSLFLSLPPPKSSSISSPLQTLTNPTSPEEYEGEEQQQQQRQQEENSKLSSNYGMQSSFAPKFSAPAKPSSLFSSLPPPKSSSISSSLPELKSSSIFSSLPPPKTQNTDQLILANPSSASGSGPKPKKVVQFRPPINPASMMSTDADDEDEDDEKEKQSKKSISSGQTSTVKSFLSSMLPAPKNSMSLGALPSSSGTGRRSVLATELPVSASNGSKTESEVSAYSNVNNPEGQWVNPSSSTSLGAVEVSSGYAAGGGDTSTWSSANENYESYDSYGGYNNGGVDPSNWGSASENHGNYEAYGAYGDYGLDQVNWVDGSVATAAPETTGTAGNAVSMPGKRGRNDVPQEIVEVKQDELMRNRPREDQVKLTGIAFGPSYQPASTKGKPSKLHKRKHQIGSLYFDMRQKEMELAERRARGLLTKSQTQGKYGW